ncbi:MAG: P27 family phage terminase small subunit [Pseudomonadota bacterium]
MSGAGRKSKLGGRLAKTGARGLRFAKATTKTFTPPPAHFCDLAQDLYWTIATDLSEAGELGRSDAPLIEMAARAYARWHALDCKIAEGEATLADPEKANADVEAREVGDKGFMSGAAQARAAAAKEYRSCVGELGLSPAARIKTSGALQSSFLAELDKAAAPEAGGANVLSMAERRSVKA